MGPTVGETLLERIGFLLGLNPGPLATGAVTGLTRLEVAGFAGTG